MKPTLKQKLIISFILVSALTLAVSSFLFYRAWLDYAVRAKKAEIVRQGNILSTVLASGVPEQNSQLTNRLVRLAAEVTGARVFITDEAGNIMANAGAPLQRLAQRRLGRLNQQPGPVVADEYVPNLDATVVYTSVPIRDGSNRRLLIVAPVQDIKRAQGPALNMLLVSGIISFIIASSAGLYLAVNLMRPLDRLKLAVRDMGRGRFKQNVRVDTGDELGELVRAFNLMSVKVDTAYTLQRDFASSASHELKTPLTSIEGFSKALLDGKVADEEERRKYLRIINTESRRITKIVNGLLALARIDAGTYRFEISEVKVGDILSRIDDKFTPLAADKEVKLTVAPTAFSFNGDEDVVEQIVGNLVENAVKYAGAGGDVDVAVDIIGKDVQFRVKDTGPGISPEEQGKVFERFYRSKTASAQGGSGLGLAVCKALVDAMGGTIEVFSASNKGTEFTVMLPR